MAPVLPAGAQVLFLHTNYPAQFRFLVKGFHARGWQVSFASHTCRNHPLAGIRHIPLRSPAVKGSKLDLLEARSLLAFQDLLQAKRTGLQPNLIYCHTGWGLGSFLRELFPRARVIAYSEWWFDFNAADFRFDPQNAHVRHDLDTRLKMMLRNQGFAYELLRSDAVVAPTRWQRRQLPPGLRPGCRVIFDGIDPEMFCPGPAEFPAESPLAALPADTPLLTYATRGLEPYRGFPEFARAALALLRAEPRWHVAIAGKDAPSYYAGRSSPPGFGARALEAYKAAGVADRVHHLGTLPLPRYRDLLRRSTLHCYFTRPFVLSWSLLESALCGCRLFVSNTPPVQEFLSGDPGTTLVDHCGPELDSQLIRAAREATGPTAGSPAERLACRGALLRQVAAPLCLERHLALAAEVLAGEVSAGEEPVPLPRAQVLAG